MLLLFWKSLGLTIGLPSDIKWYHSTGYPPRCLVPGELGLSVVNPFLLHDSVECSYVLLNEQCNTADVYGGDLLIGTNSYGIKSVDWSVVESADCLVQGPANLYGSVGTFTTFSGLLSQNIISIEANNEYLGVVTGSGLCYGKQGQPDYYTFSTESGKACYVCQTDMVYLAEGDRVLAKDSPVDFSAWDREYNLEAEVNDIWVTEKGGINTLFVATESGVVVFERDQEFLYGDSNYSQIKAEVGTTINQGHVFAVSDQTVDIINMRNKELENSLTYSGGIVVVAIENKRLYSK